MAIQISPEEVKKVVLRSGQKFIENHKCCMCDYPVGYIITDVGEVYYDRGCRCIYQRPERIDWSDMARYLNMQSREESQKDILKSFGFSKEEIDELFK